MDFIATTLLTPFRTTVIRGKGQTEAIAKRVAGGAALAHRLGDAAVHRQTNGSDQVDGSSENKPWHSNEGCID